MLVLGIDVALRRTGVAAIEDGKAKWRATVDVEGDPEETGPRFVELRRAIEKLLGRLSPAPDVVAIEQPEHAIRGNRDAGNIMKLYGAFAVAFAECARLWPRARICGVKPEQWKGHLDKRTTATMMRCKYNVKEFANLDEADALSIADWAWDVAVAFARKKSVDKAAGREA